jgi:hypothetical protein
MIDKFEIIDVFVGVMRDRRKLGAGGPRKRQKSVTRFRGSR